jgi:hypothetical protein
VFSGFSPANFGYWLLAAGFWSLASSQKQEASG